MCQLSCHSIQLKNWNIYQYAFIASVALMNPIVEVIPQLSNVGHAEWYYVNLLQEIAEIFMFYMVYHKKAN